MNGPTKSYIIGVCFCYTSNKMTLFIFTRISLFLESCVSTGAVMEYNWQVICTRLCLPSFFFFDWLNRPLVIVRRKSTSLVEAYFSAVRRNWASDAVRKYKFDLVRPYRPLLEHMRATHLWSAIKNEICSFSYRHKHLVRSFTKPPWLAQIQVWPLFDPVKTKKEKEVVINWICRLKATHFCANGYLFLKLEHLAATG